MKTFNFYKIIALFVAATFVVSCVQDDEFDIPNTAVEAPNLEGDVITIDALYNALQQEIANNGNETLTYAESNLFIEGYVVSNDEAGNFFEEIIMQDKASNPTRGVRVLIDVSPLFTYVEFGRKAYVKLDGLTVGFSNGVLTLGIQDGTSAEKIPEALLGEYLIRDPEVATIEPKVLTFSDFNDDNVNQYIRLNNVQFEASQVLGDNPQTYAGGAEDQFDGERVLESCESGQTVVFSTSTFADYKSLLLPAGSGTLDGLLTKNFFGEEFNVTVNDPTTVALDNDERCDPEQVDCGLATATGSNVLFTDFFETQAQNSPITGNGWTNFIEEGTESWEAYSDTGTNASLGISARMGSFNSGDDSSIGWLVTPAIDFDAQEGETFSFQSSNSFSDGSEMQVLISLDWDGTAANIPSANWSELPAAFIVGDDDFFGDWFPSGNVSLDCIEGTGHIAFKYIGGGNADIDGTYEIDEIEIRSN
ncbi:DUF5689 domain-containing protein [Patiriisocius marinus]|uniref:DUF5689 domain-containing protein n=1 Tax=Patiriisocius marinus TaxID=1397112 RepID=A0A5J4INA1_9FLAO|nr:DUF5689 domain-containing protein [Patiriisocius marinus]GER58829.1 hypothetical protein ULMA_09370 [Patiriisocius marinus]